MEININELNFYNSYNYLFSRLLLKKNIIIFLIYKVFSFLLLDKKKLVFDILQSFETKDEPMIVNDLFFKSFLLSIKWFSTTWIVALAIIISFAIFGNIDLSKLAMKLWSLILIAFIALFLPHIVYAIEYMSFAFIKYKMKKVGIYDPIHSKNFNKILYWIYELRSKNKKNGYLCINFNYVIDNEVNFYITKQFIDLIRKQINNVQFNIYINNIKRY